MVALLSNHSSPSFNDVQKLVHGLPVYQDPHVPASSIIEWISSRHSATSVVYIYDLAEQLGFGPLTKHIANNYAGTAPIIHLQARPGAGLNLVGRLSEGTSQQGAGGTVLTVFTTITGLAAMASSLSKLPVPRPDSRLIVQVPAVTPIGSNFVLSPTLASLSTIVPLLPKDTVVLISAAPQESVDFASLAYSIKHKHVIHIFDYYDSVRETGHSIVGPKTFAAEGELRDTMSAAGYNSFQYHGDPSARAALVLLNGPLACLAKAYVDQIPGLGLLVVKVLRPWDESALACSLPLTVQKVHVLDEVTVQGMRGFLFADVLGSLLSRSGSSSTHAHPLTPIQIQTYLNSRDTFLTFLSFLSPSRVDPALTVDHALTKKLVVFSSPKSSFGSLAHLIGDLFFKSQHIVTHMLGNYDVISKQGGISIDRVVLTSGTHADADTSLPVSISLPLSNSSKGEADFTAILDHTLLNSHSLVKHAKPESLVLLVAPWTAAELCSSLPAETLDIISARSLRIFLFNVKSTAAKMSGSLDPTNASNQRILVYLAFLRLYLGKAADEASIYKLAKIVFDDEVHGVPLSKFIKAAWLGVEEVAVASPTPPSQVGSPSLKDVSINAVSVEVDDSDSPNGSPVETWHGAAKHLIFPDIYKPPNPSAISEHYPQNPALRPEVPDRTYLVTCTVNRRLTPWEYDRNVFHLEFDTSGTGLTYSIGEALGVHGWNDTQEVLDFCDWYGIDPDRLVTIPLPSSEGTKMHTRTIFQVLQQQIDLFGHPPKSFYTELSQYATKSADKHALQFIGSPEGSATYKKLSEKDTVHFVDVLKAYPSAHPGVEVLCALVGDIKPRHYSIASAQAVVGDRVDLLVVTVDWVTPTGSLRYGQCTRYLAGLKVGQKVTVSIKPSVMKLPPSNLQPIIMAGLGTGAAPFRAFLQYRAWLAQKGERVGPTYYYFGSRHQSQEYLYGEEIEAYVLDGTITKAGLAFSRDGPQKVYIQHKMLEDAEVLSRSLKEEQGAFYLCGPTWPVPDVYEALVGALVKYNGMAENEAAEYLEGLKEEERYVLEVY